MYCIRCQRIGFILFITCIICCFQFFSKFYQCFALYFPLHIKYNDCNFNFSYVIQEIFFLIVSYFIHISLIPLLFTTFRHNEDLLLLLFFSCLLTVFVRFFSLLLYCVWWFIFFYFMLQLLLWIFYLNVI